MIDTSHDWSRSYKPLIVGFVLSVILTLATYFTVVERYFSHLTLVLMVIALGTVQAVIQLAFFFHLGVERRPRWNLITFLFMVLVIVVVMGGSLWIMYNLNYNMMPGMKH